MKTFCICLPFFFSSVFAFGQTVTFNGIDKSHKQSRLVISKFSKTFDFEYELILTTIGEAVYKNDSAFTINMEIKVPTSVQISNSSPPVFSQIAWLEEGDSITITLDANNRERPLHITGENSLKYTIYQEYDQLEKEIRKAELKGFDEFEKAYEALQNRLFFILDEGLSDGSVEQSFVNLFKVETRARYYALLWSLAYSNFDDSQKEKMMKTLENRDFPNIGNPTLLSSRSYTNALSKVAAAYRSPALSDDEKYTFDIDFISQHFDGNVQEFLLADLTREYAKNNSIYISHSAYIKNTEEILPRIQDSVYKKWALANLKSFDKQNKAFPEEVLDDLILDNEKERMDFRGMLAKYKEKPILLDFWASWCIPCISEFEGGKEQISEWKEKGVVFLNLSIDRPSDYIKMDEVANKFQFQETNYIIPDFKTSKLYHYLNIGRSGIPRYVLIGKSGEIQVMDMPRPSHKESFNNVMQKFVVFADLGSEGVELLPLMRDRFK